MMLILRIVLLKSWIKRFKSYVEVCNFSHANDKQITMRCYSYNFGLIVLVMLGNFAKLDSPRRFVQFSQNFQTSLVLLISNCHNRMITYTNWLLSNVHEGMSPFTT